MSRLIYNQLAKNKLFNKSIKFGLNRIKLALRLLGNPERKLNNVINVIGESGKFTTLYSLKSFIEANNQTVFWVLDSLNLGKQDKRNYSTIKNCIIPDNKPFHPAWIIKHSLPSIFDNAIGIQSAVRAAKARPFFDVNIASVLFLGSELWFVTSSILLP